MKPEELLSSRIATWCHAWLPDDVYATAIPGGGWGPVTGQRWKRMGYSAGCPDWLIVRNGLARFIELKAAKGSTSSAQDEAHVRLAECGAVVTIARSLDEFRAQIRDMGIKIRATPRAVPGLDDEVPTWA